MDGILNRGRREIACKDNYSGVKHIYLFNFTPYFYTAIEVIEGVELISYPPVMVYRYELRGDYNFSQSLNDDGEWQQILECQLKKIDTDTSIELNRIARNLTACIVEMESGKFALVGLRNGCELSVNTTTGAQKSEFSGYNLTVEALEEYQAPLFDSLEDVGFDPVDEEAFLLQENDFYLLQENDFKIKL